MGGGLMSSDSPASILFDELGNPVGVIFDGHVYRLQVQGTLVDASGNQLVITGAGAIKIDGSTVIQPVSGTITAVQPVASQLNATVVGTGTDNTPDVTTKFPVIAAVAAAENSFGEINQNWTDGYMVPLTTDLDGHLQVDIQADNSIGITFSDDAQLDAFQRLRVAEPLTLFDNKQLVDKQPLFWDDQQTSGSGTTSTYNTNQASTTIAVANATAGMRVRQTFQHFNYQPGKSIFIAMTGVLGVGAPGVTRRIGYFDANNGVFFQLSGTTISVVIRSDTSGSPVDTVIPQSSWNTDKLDGTGVSGITLDTSKTQIFIIDFQWLGVGRIRFGFDIGGEIQHCNIVNNANTMTQVYMSMPNLPLRYEISNDGTGAAANLVHICSTVISEGGRVSTGPVFAADMGATALTTNNDANLYPLIVIRQKSTYQSAEIDPLLISILNISGDNYRYCLLLNPTIIGTALSFSDVTNSAMQVATPTNATTVSGGTQLFSGYGVGSGSGSSITSTPILQPLASDLRLGSSIAGVSDIIVLAVQRITGTTSIFYGGISWREQI
jgi:hypothetical protein